MRLISLYIYYNSCTTSLCQTSLVFDLLLFRSARPFYTVVHYVFLVCCCTWTSITPSRPWRMYIAYANSILGAREIEVIMRVRVRLCLNACVSRRMHESWQLCLWWRRSHKKFNGRWCGMQLSPEEDDQLGECSFLWRPFVTTAQMTPWHAHMLMVTYLERPWDSWSIRTFKFSFSSVYFICFSPVFVTHSVTFPSGVMQWNFWTFLNFL